MEGRVTEVTSMGSTYYDGCLASSYGPRDCKCTEYIANQGSTEQPCELPREVMMGDNLKSCKRATVSRNEMWPTKPLSTFQLTLSIFSFRLVNALLCQTFFQPDEFYQSQEVAHRLVFGYGFQSWEWREARLRSPLHPLLLVPVYWTLKILGLEQTSALVCASFLSPGLRLIGSTDSCPESCACSLGNLYRLLHIPLRTQCRWRTDSSCSRTALSSCRLSSPRLNSPLRTAFVLSVIILQRIRLSSQLLKYPRDCPFDGGPRYVAHSRLHYYFIPGLTCCSPKISLGSLATSRFGCHDQVYRGHSMATPQPTCLAQVQLVSSR